jgi:transposase
MPTLPDWAIEHRKPGTAIHRIKNYYYLYEVSSFWDTESKKTKRKTGKCLGRITEQGFVASGLKPKRTTALKLDTSKPISVKEYGVTYFILSRLSAYLKTLEDSFPEHWKHIALLSYCRLVHQSTINQMPFHIHNSYLSVTWPDLSFTDKTISALLYDIGRDRATVVKFMKLGLSSSENLLIDMTNLPSKSSRIPLAKSGYNSDWDFESQFNLLYIYSTEQNAPMFYRVVPGNIRDVSALSMTIKESGVTNCTIIGDKGFYSKANAEVLESEGLFYIMPLKRDNSLIEYELIAGNAIKTGNNYFKFENRVIWFTSYKPQGSDKHLYLFLDGSLRISEENDYLSRIESKIENYTIEGYHAKKDVFGTIALITNLQGTDAYGVYTAYKTRMSIEGVFDVYKTVLKADRTYMQRVEVLQGWLFINHIAVQWHYQLYHLLVKHDLLKKYSIQNLIQHLAEIKMLKINDSWTKAETIKATDNLLKKLSLPVA